MKHLLFDLDGTLVDSGPAIVASIRVACAECALTPPDDEAIWRFVGPPLGTSLKLHYGIDDADFARRFTDAYRASYLADGLHKAEPYAGIRDFLKREKAAGRRLFVATSKPRVHATTLLEGNGLAGEFERIYGSELDGRLFDKSDLIGHILDREALESADSLMIGDRSYDASGAAANGVTMLGVLWGYGSDEELRAAGAHALCRDVAELEDRIARLERATLTHGG